MPCRFPHKHRFETRKLAKLARKRFDHARDDRLSPFLCECGYWHLGRLPKAVKRGLMDRL